MHHQWEPCNVVNRLYSFGEAFHSLKANARRLQYPAAATTASSPVDEDFKNAVNFFFIDAVLASAEHLVRPLFSPFQLQTRVVMTSFVAPVLFATCAADDTNKMLSSGLFGLSHLEATHIPCKAHFADRR
jgi:hypothetical protein